MTLEIQKLNEDGKENVVLNVILLLFVIDI